MMKNHTRDICLNQACGTVIAKQDTLAGVVLKMPGEVFNVLLTWQERATTRARLRELDARFLDDVGLSAQQAYREARKPFWIK